MAIFQRQKERLAEAKEADDENQRERKPEQDMDPERRFGGKLQPDGQAGDQPADDEDQEGGRAVADIETGEIQPAGAAFWREAGDAAEQSPGAAARAQAAKRHRPR